MVNRFGFPGAMTGAGEKLVLGDPVVVGHQLSSGTAIMISGSYPIVGRSSPHPHGGSAVVALFQGTSSKPDVLIGTCEPSLVVYGGFTLK